MINYRRIALYGGPNAGKSSMAGFIYSRLKAKHYDIELVREVIKKYIYRSEKITNWDQIPLYGLHVRDEIDYLHKGNVKYIVTDGPTRLIAIYAMINKMPGWKHLFQLEDEYNNHFPALNIFLNRKNIRFNNEGRIHNKIESEKVDEIIKESVRDYVSFDFNDVSGICKYITSKCPRS